MLPSLLKLRLKLKRVPWFGVDRRGKSRREQRFRMVRDLIGGFVILGIILGAMFVASNGAWPPLIVIESGSMMHDTSETSYGRIGTIDVGDILFVRHLADPRHEVHTWAEGGEEHYGRPGDVIEYCPKGDCYNASLPPIIHRAMAWVDVTENKDRTHAYVVHWTDGRLLTFGDEGIYLPELGFDEGAGFSPGDGWRPGYSGFITKGDNPGTNPISDQAANITSIVDPSWVQGAVHGEIPWLGLGKLALQYGQTNPQMPGWTRVGNAFAPIELWSMFFLCLCVIIIIPVSWDTYRIWRAHRSRRKQEREVEEEIARRNAERAQRTRVTLEVVSRGAR